MVLICSCDSGLKLGMWAAGQSGIWGLGSALLCVEGANVYAWNIKCHPVLGAAGICWVPLCAHMHILAGAADSRLAPRHLNALHCIKFASFRFQNAAVDCCMMVC